MTMSTTAAVGTSGPAAPDLAPTTDPRSDTDTGVDVGVGARLVGTRVVGTRLVARDGGPPVPAGARGLSRSRRVGGPQLRVVREAGMATAEYAVALIAACAFAAVLLAAVRSGAVLSAIGTLIQKALEIIS